MTRYTINIGDDFPLGGDEAVAGEPPHGPRRRRRYGLFLRVLFFLAVAAIVIAHPLKTLLLTGAVLFLMRSPRFAQWRDRLRHLWRQGLAHDWRADIQWCRERWGAWQASMGQASLGQSGIGQASRRGSCGARRATGERPGEEHDRYRGFV